MTTQTYTPRRAVQAQTVEVTVQDVQAVSRLREIDAQLRQLKAEKDNLKLQLDQAMGEAYVGTYHGTPVIKRQDGSNSHFDRDILKRAFPEAFDASLVTTSYHFYKGV